MISLGPWGGPGGDHWSFKASRAITEIVITLVENNIHAISFRDASGDISGTFGGRDPNATKRVEKKIPIRPSENLISISGKYGHYSTKLVIRSLSFITNLKTNGPFGTASAADTAFSIPIPDSVVVGFHGGAGYYLDALGIFVEPVDPHNGTISLGPWGGPGGDPFSFTFQGSWIKEIIVEQGDTIDSIAFEDANGHYSKFGGNTVMQEKVTINGPSEYLTSISGTYGQYARFQVIRSLSFITNHNTHGPFGIVSGDSFTIPIEGSLVIGFHGRAGSYLDSIGIIVKPAITN